VLARRATLRSEVKELIELHDATAKLKPFAFMVGYRRDEVSVQPKRLEKKPNF
jgi:hypothetical protein